MKQLTLNKLTLKKIVLKQLPAKLAKGLLLNIVVSIAVMGSLHAFFYFFG